MLIKWNNIKKQYRIDNVEKIKEIRNIKHNCECGGKFTHSNKAQHLKTKLHQKYVNLDIELENLNNKIKLT